MLPVLFSLGPITVHTYGLVLMIAFFVMMFFIWKRGRELHLAEDELFDRAFQVFLWGFVGARIGYIVTHFEAYSFNIFAWFNVFGRPGFLFFGGLMGMLLGAIQASKASKWDVYAFLDVLAPALTIWQALMALGAFLNGSSFGIPTRMFVGMTFPGLYEKRHPVQLYEMVLYFLLFLYLWWVEGVYRRFSWYRAGRSEAKTGYITGVFLIAQGFIGLFATALRPALFTIYGVRVDLLLQFVWIIWGVRTIWVRSGMKWNDVAELLGPVKIPTAAPTTKKKSDEQIGNDIM